MNAAIRRAAGFLKDIGTHPAVLSTADTCDFFLEEMRKGLEGEPSSLQMIPTYIEMKDAIPHDTEVIVIDAGGTNLRTAIVNFTSDKGPAITDFSKRGMPGVKHEVSAHEFFSIIADAVEPIFTRSSQLGFCFSYAAEITSDRDGKLIVFSKEIKAPEVIGRYVGKELLDELAGRGHTEPKRLTLLNDTVATLLAGKAQPVEIPYSGYIGFILGTGTNTSYAEANGNIKKVSGLDPAGHQIINIESGNFALPASDFDRAYYAGTKDPSVYHFEKLISGAYIGAYGHAVLKEAVKSGLYSPGFAENFTRDLPDMNTIVMDDFLHTPYDSSKVLASCCTSEEDAVITYSLLDGVIERAAKLTAVNLAATVIKSGDGTDPRHPVCINADGTTFARTHNLKSYTEWYLHEFLGKDVGRSYEFVTIDSSPILGAAIAGLLG